MDLSQFSVMCTRTQDSKFENSTRRIRRQCRRYALTHEIASIIGVRRIYASCQNSVSISYWTAALRYRCFCERSTVTRLFRNNMRVLNKPLIDVILHITTYLCVPAYVSHPCSLYRILNDDLSIGIDFRKTTLWISAGAMCERPRKIRK